jgi:hypothetical protein
MLDETEELRLAGGPFVFPPLRYFREVEGGIHDGGTRIAAVAAEMIAMLSLA